jgi:hypothetical protein
MDKGRQNFLNFTSIFFYFGLIVLVGFLMRENGYNIWDIPTRDLIILSLASFRLTRMIVFEKIFKFGRDLIRSNNKYSFFSTLLFIVTCPWCAGVWMVLVMIVFFFLVPYGQLLVYALAIAGIASFIVQLSNLIGLHLEEKQGGKFEKET